MKKFISLITVLVLIFSFASVTVFADSSYTDADYAAWVNNYYKSLNSYKYKVYNMQDKGLWYSGKEVTEKAPNNFRFDVSAPYNLNFDVFIDGVKVDWDDYTSWGNGIDSTFELSNEFMKTLTEGEHRVSVWFTDGYRGAGYFTVKSGDGAKEK